MMLQAREELAELSGLIDLIYKGATEPGCWDTTLAALSDYVEAPYAFLHTPLHPPDAGGYMYSRQIPAGIFENWPRFLPHDIYAKEGLVQGRFRDGVVVTGEDILPREQFESSIFYRDYLAHYGFCYMLAGIVFGNEHSDLLPTTCIYYRGPEHAPFSENQRRRLRLVMPHLSRALGVMQRLRNADLRIAASRAALDLLRAGVLLIGSEGEIVFANRRALRLIGEGDGLKIRSHAKGTDRLSASDAKAQQAINAALLAAISPEVLKTPHFAQSIPVPRYSGRAAYQLSFSSLSLENEFGTGGDMPRAIVFITDPEQPLSVDAEWLRGTYGLTSAEAKAAIMSMRGDSTARLAAVLGISVNTLRTQLQQVYAKTGTGNRARLVRLLISLSEVE